LIRHHVDFNHTDYLEKKMKLSDQFETLGYAYFKNIITEDMCNHFTQLMYNMKDTNKGVSFEGKTDQTPHSFYNQSWGGNHQDFEDALRTHVQPRLENELNLRLKVQNSFARIYYNGGTLDRHVDRPGLDYTLSITLFHNLDENWPLWCIDKKGNEVALKIDRGDGGLMLGTSMEHWRDPLVCRDDQHAVQLFMHWELQ